MRVTTIPASKKRRKAVRKLAKGSFGDRKGHNRQTQNAVMKAMAYNYVHRKDLKSNMRTLWTTRINVAGRMVGGISYSRLIAGLNKASCVINRKVLSDIAINDIKTFTKIVEVAKGALVKTE